MRAIEGNAETVVIGYDSFIGRAIFGYLKRSGVQVVGTTRRREKAKSNGVFLDLSQETCSWQLPLSIKTAVICAGVTKLSTCMSDPFGTARVNVERILTLIDHLIRNNVFVVYLSSDQVYDGSVPYRRAEDSPCPKTEYGKQKAAVEGQINSWDKAIAIVRLTKVIGPCDQLFTSWINDLLRGKIVRPFIDMSIAPIPLSSVVAILKLIIDGRMSGIIQISGDRDVSYSDALQMGAQLLDIELELVQPAKAGDLGYTEYLPTYTSLNIDRLKNELGVVPPEVAWTLRAAFCNPLLLAGLHNSDVILQD